jgi:hypothetical protein
MSPGCCVTLGEGIGCKPAYLLAGFRVRNLGAAIAFAVCAIRPSDAVRTCQDSSLVPIFASLP